MIASYEKQAEDNHGVSEEQERLLMEFAKQRADLIRKKNELNAQRQQRKTGQTSRKVYTYSGGKLGLPLQADYYISSPFGYRTDPITGAKARSTAALTWRPRAGRRSMQPRTERLS